MTDEQYHELMCQMRDLGMMSAALALPNVSDEKLITTLMERLHRRADDSAPITNLADTKKGVTYCVTRVNFNGDPDGHILRLATLGFVVGVLVTVISRAGDCLEVDLMGSKIAVRAEDAKAISIIKFPEQR